MRPQTFCQSCTMPLDNIEERGTERDGSRSELYCKYCYQNGNFTDPDMTLEKMMDIAKAEMNKQQLPDNIIQQSMNMLPTLKRWQTSPARS